MTLSPSILATLDDLADRHEELSALLGESEIVSNRDKFTALSKEFRARTDHRTLSAHQHCANGRRANMLDDDDVELRQLASDDRDELRTHRGLEQEIGCSYHDPRRERLHDPCWHRRRRSGDSLVTCSAGPDMQKKNAGV
jgi:protein subunit release factor A